jgi:ribosome-binding factor A
MGSNRPHRVGDLIRAEISELLLKKIRDPRIGFLTITTVEMTRDLRRAKVFFSTIGSIQEREQTLIGLKSATGFIKRELGGRLSLRYMPELIFQYDPSIEHGNRILRVIDESKKGE